MKKLRSDFEKEVTDHYEFEESYLRAKKKVDKLKGFYWHFAVYVVINLFLIIMAGIGLEEGESLFQFNTFATAFFWGIGLFFHWISVFGPDFLLGKNWEEKKMKEYIEKENRSWE